MKLLVIELKCHSFGLRTNTSLNLFIEHKDGLSSCPHVLLYAWFLFQTRYRFELKPLQDPSFPSCVLTQMTTIKAEELSIIVILG